MRRSTRRTQHVEEEAAGDHDHAHQHPHHQEVLGLQRTIGNQAVADMMTVQRMDVDMDREDSPLTPVPEDFDHQVISGHGAFNANHLADHPTARRKKTGTFVVPNGMTVIMYAPHGAALDNAVANRVELGSPPSADELELKHSDGTKTKPMPAGYPFTFNGGQTVVDYTVSPPDRLKIEGTPVTVTTPTPLRTLVDQAKADMKTTVHYACCGAAHGVPPDFKDLFTDAGWHVRFKDPAAYQ
jgi:hypothetical protein